MSSVFNRRTLIAGIVAAFGTPPLPSRRSAEAAILAALSDRRSAALIGRSASWPTQGRDRPLDQILADLRLEPEDAAHMQTSEIRRRLAARIRADFAEGRTIRRDGWLIAVTEARLCALAALCA
ncbi:MAG TPA: hypothetical protein VHV26_02155 [Rhizomicrobium sp.]|jgi:hypothetical protein|nr:hypothetical protein [Rhizomicrobium sp.]